MKDYSGNRIPYIYLMFHESDRERVLPVLEAMEGHGLRFCGVEQQNISHAKKALAVLAFLSEAFVQEQQSAFFAAKDLGIPLIPVMLETMDLPPLMQQALYAQNSILANRYPTPKALADRILTAQVFANPTVTPAQKRASRLRLGMLCGGAAAVLALALMLLLPKAAAPVVEEVVQTTYENPFDFTQEDLEAIRGVTIIGEHVQFLNKEQLYSDINISLDFLGHREQDRETVRWFWSEDGTETSVTEYDLTFLQMMPNVQSISLAMVSAPAMPDLSELNNLREVDIRDCMLENIQGMADSAVRMFNCEDSTIRDLSPLSSCTNLQEAVIKQTIYEGVDYSGFCPPQLTKLSIRNAPHLGAALDLSGLQQCTHLRELRISGFDAASLDGLAELKSVCQLYLDNFPNLRNIAALRTLPIMTSLEIWEANSLYDLSPLGDCTQLRNMHLVGIPASDIRFMDALVNLEVLGLHVQESNLNFLRNLKQKTRINLYISGPIQDFSGLEAIESFDDLHINLDDRSYHELVEPYLEKKVVYHEMSLYRCRDVQMEKLPELRDTLSISFGNLKNLSGLKDQIRSLNLENMQNLVSLEGLEVVKFLRSMAVNGCMRLGDWSAMEGMRIGELALGGMASLPDLGSFYVISRLTLDSMLDMTDLTALEKMPNQSIDLRLPGMERLEDLSALNGMQGSELAVPPELETKAMKLVENGCFHYYSIVFPEGEWRNELQFSLESLDELETLPQAVLEKVTTLHLIGDTIYQPQEYMIWEDWRGDKVTPYLHNDRTGEEKKVSFGSIERLSQLDKLTGLKELSLIYQPLTDLNGIQQFASLRRLVLNHNNELEDLSPVFSLDALEWIEARHTGISSIQGIQNIHRLTGLDVGQTKVTDLSPLEQCDFSFINGMNDGFFLTVDGLQIKEFPALSRIQRFNWVNITGLSLDIRQILPAFAGSYIDGMTVGDMVRTQEDLEYVVDTLPTLRRIHLFGCHGVTDLSVLLRLDNLTEVLLDDQLRSKAVQLTAQKPSIMVN